MTTENAQERGGQQLESASENTIALPRRRRGRAGLGLPDPFAAVLDVYTEALRSAPPSDQTRRTYASKFAITWPGSPAPTSTATR